MDGLIRGRQIGDDMSPTFASPARSADERRCPECGTVLSRYNRDPYCYRHRGPTSRRTATAGFPWGVGRK